MNRKRYSVLIAVRLEGNKARIDVSLDERLIISWQGRQESLAVEPNWSLPEAYRPGIAGNQTDIVYHTATVRAIDGKARTQTHDAPAIDLKLPGWTDLLADANPDRDAVFGRWLKAGDVLDIAPASGNDNYVRFMFPRNVEGSFNLLSEFTRKIGSDRVAFILPVGARQCTLVLSASNGPAAWPGGPRAWGGLGGGLEVIDGHPLGDLLNPAVRYPTGLVNGHRYQLLAKVRTRDDNAVIDTWLDGKPFMHWAGKQSSLDNSKEWSLPEHWRVGVGANRSDVEFHTVRLLPVK